MRTTKTNPTNTTNTTELEVLQWHLSLLGTKRASTDTIFFLEGNTRNNKTIDDLTGQDIIDLIQLGYRASIEEYLGLVKRIDPTYLKQINKFIDTTFEGLYKQNFNDFIDYILDFYGTNGTYKDYIKEKGIKPMDYDIARDITYFYLVYEGFRNGFILNNNNTKSIKPDFSETTIHREEIIEIYILLNGGYRPNNNNPTLEDFKKGQYNKHHYGLIKYIIQHIIQVRPELVGKHNIRINRDKILEQLISDKALII